MRLFRRILAMLAIYLGYLITGFFLRFLGITLDGGLEEIICLIVALAIYFLILKLLKYGASG